MPVNLLAISTGNTRTHLGVFVEGKLVHKIAVANVQVDEPDFLEVLRAAMQPLQGAEEPVVLMASVDQHVSSKVARLVGETLGMKPLLVEKDLKIPIGRQLDPETIVGDDRLLNAAAAYNTLKQACIVVDAGTAVTVDFIDGAGTFHGGAIAPGARMMLHALRQGTDQLPEVELRKPLEPIGHNTAEAMRSAVFHGIRGMVRELVERFAEGAGMFPLVVATGGDAEFLFGDDELIERLVPDLTLMGMAVTLESHLENMTD
jgi:type III pantothenate kinase